MKPITATLLAAALSAAFTSAYAADTKADTSAYRNMTQKAAADYNAATANCKGLTGNAHQVCHEEAKVARARSESDAVAQYNNTLPLRTKARTALANAEYALANVKCAVMTGADKDNCVNNARSVQTAALADAKADRAVRVADAGTANGMVGSPVTTTDTRDAKKAAAVDKCAQVAGQPNTGCLIDNKGTATAAATTAGATAGAMANRTENAASNVAQKTENLAERAVDKTKQVAHTVAAKTEHAVDKVAAKTDRATDNMAAKTDRASDNMAAKTDRATDNMGAKTDRAADATGKVVADSVITTKVKADIFKEPELKSMAIHVETEKGVVMLSGFVDSKADAEKAVRLAKSVEGVSSVKSAIKVK